MICLNMDSKFHKMICPECERLWATYAYTLKELSKLLIAAELSGNRLGLRDMEESRAFLRAVLREHALSHSEEEILALTSVG